MMVMPANNTSGLVHFLAGIAPGSVGHLYTPARTERPKSWLPYVLDNGAFALAVNQKPFDDVAWQKALNHFASHAQPPKWFVVPDTPFDGESTLEQWNRTAESYLQFRVPLALAVQDGMTPEIVSSLSVKPSVIFIGGATEWKWKTVKDWCGAFPRVHVARVNGRRGLKICHDAGAESCDGSGWFRGDVAQILELVEFIADTRGLNLSDLQAAARSSRHSREQQYVLRLEESA